MTRRATWWMGAALIAGLALAASANSITNGFVYDDTYTISIDPRAHSLDGWWKEFGQTYWAPRWGGDGYRPVTRILFRLAWVAGDGSPVAFHAMNIAFHVAGSVLVLWLASALLPFAAAWIAAALYSVHPVHTEAIANSVGIGELGVMLLLVLGTGLYVRARAAGPVTAARWAAIAAVYAVACFIKEHAIVFPALLVLAEVTVVPDRARLRERLTRMRLPLLVLAVVALGFLWARTSVVRGVSGFVPSIAFQTLKLSASDRILTMIGAAPEWYRLLLWPQRLMTDYMPPYLDIAEGPALRQLPGLLLLVGTFGLMFACWRRSPVTSFGIGWIAITLLPSSNFIVPAGILLAERTLLLPSVGAMIALASAIPWLYPRIEGHRVREVAAAAVVVLLLALGITRSVNRNAVWRSNDTLFAQGVLDGPDNYRLHYLYGNHLMMTGHPEQGVEHLQAALRLFPYDPVLPYLMAEQLRARGLCEPAVRLYAWAVELARNYRSRQLGRAYCLLQLLRLDEAERVTHDALRNGARYTLSRDMLRAIDAGRDSLAARRARGDSAGTLPVVPVASEEP